MLVNASNLIGCPILSLHVGGQIAQVVELIVDPDNLSLLAVRVEGPVVEPEEGDILAMTSVREFSRAGMIVDSDDEFVRDDDVIQIQKVLKLNFDLRGLKVVTKKGAKLGKVDDFVLQSSAWNVQQLIVRRPIMKALVDPELIISRDKVVEIDDYQVVVKDEHEKTKSKVKSPPVDDFVPDFVNPFRQPDLAPENQSSDSE